MGLLGNLSLGSLFGAADAFVEGANKYHWDKKTMDYQAKIQEQQYRQRYQWAVEDMKKAGLNPLLAATSGIAGSLSGVSSAGSIGGSISNAAVGVSNSAAANRQAKTGEELGKSTIKLNASSANKLDADAKSILQALEFNKQYFPYELAAKGVMVENAKKQGELLKAQEEGQKYQNNFVLPALQNLYTLQGIQANSAAALNSQNAALSAANTRLVGKQADDYENYGVKGDGYLGPVMSFGARLGEKLQRYHKKYFGEYNDYID